MWLNWNDFDRHFAALDSFRRQIERAWRFDTKGLPERGFSSWPEAIVDDDGEAYTFSLDLPGVREEDLEIELEDRTLTIGAKRAVDVPEGYSLVRSERRSWEWRKSLTLPGRVDAEKTKASLDNGVLSVRVEKLPENKPRRISVSV